MLLDKVPDPTERDSHATRAAQHGWSRAMLTHLIVTGLNAQAGEA